MLEVVREYALDQLEAKGEAEATRLRHARYFTEIAIPKEQGPGDSLWLAGLVREHDNVSSALGLLLELEPEQGAAMASALFYYWYARSLYSEGLGWVRRALTVLEVGRPLWVRMLSARGALETGLGEHEAAVNHLRAAVEASRAVGQAELLNFALNNAAIAYLESGDFARAREHYEEAVAIARETGHPNLGVFVSNLSDLANAEGDYPGALAYAEEALGLATSPNNRLLCLINLGDALVKTGDVEGARARLRDALVLLAPMSYRRVTADAIACVADLALLEGAPDRAVRLAGAAEAALAHTGGVWHRPTRESRDRLLAALREVLDPSTLEREWAAGRAMSFEEAIAEALASVEKNASSPGEL
jgi:tetratricopeptide (TPR) repeat protein